MSNLLGKKRQALTTMQTISNALISLISEYPYDDIAVYHILEEAGVSRRTFYRYFCNKEAAMEYCMSLLVLEYYEERAKFFQATKPEDVFYVTLDFMYQKRKFIRSLILSGHYDTYATIFNDNSSIIYKTFNLPWSIPGDTQSKDINFVSKVLTGAFINVIRYWLVEEEPEAPEEVAKDFAVLFSAIPTYFGNFEENHQKDLLNSYHRQLNDACDNQSNDNADSA